MAKVVTVGLAMQMLAMVMVRLIIVLVRPLIATSDGNGKTCDTRLMMGMIRMTIKSLATH